MLIKVGLVTQKFTGSFIWITHVIKEVKQASSLDEDLGWASISAREASDLEFQFFGLEQRMGASGSLWTARFLHSSI